MNLLSSRILIVDDQPANARVLAEALGKGFETLTADGPARALELAPTADLVLLDARMLEVCARLKADETTRGIPVVFVAASEQIEDQTRGFETGADDCVVKPIHPPILRARVRTHLELKAARDFLKRLDTQDNLTGLANRRRFDDALAEEWRRSMRTSHFLSLVKADLDHFKEFNGRHGQQGGDTCLRHVAGALQRLSRRPGEVAARYGGAEFAFLLPDVDLDGARLFVSRVLGAVAGVAVEGLTGPGSLGVSVGAVTVIPSPLNSLEDALKAADEGLYRAKKTGRHRGVVRDLETGDSFDVLPGA